jgi:tetrahydromethanopterin S-methyltransferase subunit B
MFALLATAMGIATNGCGQRITSPVAVTADTTRPAVNSTNPANLATGVLLNRQITAAFSEALDPATITAATFTLKQGTNPVAGAVSYAAAGAVATFDPASDLTASTVYTATLTTGIKDLDGNTLASNYVWSFTTGTATDITPPTVSSTVPANLATGVAVGGNIAVTFSEAMNPSTITVTSFTLKQGTTVISGVVTSLNATATFNPSANLAASTVYTATITTGVTDLAGNAMVTAYVWTFTTGTTADVTPPTVVTTIPADAAIDIATNANIYVTFSEAMDPLTITASTIILKQGSTVISGAVTSPSTTTATLNPGSDLANNTVYTVTVTTGVKDLAGNAMAVAKVWSFTTIAAGTAGPPPVDLGTAGNYVLLSKTGISTTGATSVVGNMGVSPASATYITGFGLIMDVSNTFATSSLVTGGKVYASDYYPPTPANLTTAISDLETAFTDAAGRTNPTATELGAGNITSLTLAPGLYKWSSGVLINAPGVTLTGGVNDVWIFQIAQDLDITSGAFVTLSGGAQAKNIFWQVSGQVNLGTGADFKGNVLCQTLMSMQTGSVFKGRALVQAAVTLDAATVTAP